MHSSWHGTMPEYVPGRDTFVEEDSVAMGYTLRQQGQVVLSTGAVSVRFSTTLHRAPRPTPPARGSSAVLLPAAARVG